MKLKTSDLHETTEEQVSSNTQPEIQKVNNFLPHLKDAIATLSYKAAMSIDKTRVAVQATCKKTYGHLNYITKEEQRKYKPHLERIDEVDEERNDESSEPKMGKPRSSEECKNYQYILPDSRVVNEFNHQKAWLQEITAAKALAKKADTTRVMLHYDTTSRCRIDGEWPSIILNFLNDYKEKCCMYNLHALFFSYEDRKTDLRNLELFAKVILVKS